MGVAWLEVTHWAWKRAEKCPVVHDPKLFIPFSVTPNNTLSKSSAGLSLQVYLLSLITAVGWNFVLLQSFLPKLRF